ncbi:phage protein Gp36 family protein [Limnobaculum xujianqingii]|uniref:phage protein Gp36 family protein n=1 Tax=Limnobaculum xujianqingii TaxID=2738837 RepID=UPI002AC31435|nr:phage protein Gp36 family protein [Limnobaculum xujianqingii]
MYATLQDMQDVFGQAELIKLTDRDRRGEIDLVVVGKSLARAASEIDSYIGGALCTAADTVDCA